MISRNYLADYKRGRVSASADNRLPVLFLFLTPSSLVVWRFKMANPQLEDGFLRIANEVWEHLTAIRIPGRARQVLDFIIRKTWGFSKKEDKIPLSQFVEATGIDKRQLHREFTTLQKMNLITKIGDGISVTYSFNKDYDTWIPSPKKVTSPIKVTVITKMGDNRHLYRGRSSPIKPHSKDTLKDISKNTSKDSNNEKEKIPYSEIISDLNEILQLPPKRQFRDIESNRKLIRERWKEGHQLEDFQYVHRVKVASWFHDPKMRSFLRPSTLYRASKFPGYLAEPMPGESPLDGLSEKGRATFLAGLNVVKQQERQREKDNEKRLELRRDRE